MIRYLLPILIILIVLQKSIGQQTAQWETTIYVEDAIGNMDSVVIGKDVTASKYMNVFGAEYEVNTQFGEEDISHIPWDSVFEVRTANHVEVRFTDPERPFFQSKKAISNLWEGHLGDDCIFAAGLPPVLIRAIHKPVTITWDTTLFDNPCMLRTFIASHHWPSAVVEWMYPEFVEETQCMKTNNSFTTNLPILNNAAPGFGLTAKLVEIEGGTLDTVIGLQVYSHAEGDFLTPCEHASLTDIEDLKYETDEFVYPNPAGDVLYVTKTKKQHDYYIYDLQGQLLLYGSSDEVDISGLISATYIISQIDKKGNIRYQKFIKM